MQMILFSKSALNITTSNSRFREKRLHLETNFSEEVEISSILVHRQLKALKTRVNPPNVANQFPNPALRSEKHDELAPALAAL